MSWRYGLTPEQIREAEMARGTQVITEVHGAVTQMLAQRFDPDYKPPEPTHKVSAASKEYNRRLAEQNKNRWGD
jgi:hypothetical protein